MQSTEDDATTSEVHETPHMKSGRPFLLPDKLDLKVQECIKELWRDGASIGVATSVVVATAQGVIMNKNADLLVSNGGYINLTDNWVKSLQNQMGFVKKLGAQLKLPQKNSISKRKIS